MEFHWYVLKDPIAHAFGDYRSLLHVAFGGIVFAAVLFLQRNRQSPILNSWLFIPLIEILDEIGDVYDAGRIRVVDTISDVLLTMLIPTLMAIVFLRLVKKEC
jgi:hypothetical protein